MDGLIPPPALEDELAKLGTWILAQPEGALRDLPVSALGVLTEYIRDRLHEDRCDRLVQDLNDRYREVAEPRDLFGEENRGKPPLPVPVGGLETMWTQPPAEPPQVRELEIPRPSRATS